MTPRPSRICSIIDCERAHHGKGYCRIHYGTFVQKPAKEERSAKRKRRSERPQNANGAAS